LDSPQQHSSSKPSFSFPKEDRLTSKKEVAFLFSKSKSVFVYPFKLMYTFLDSPQEGHVTKILISVPKRTIRRATERNLIKRRIREAYRLQKNSLFPSIPLPDKVGIIYVAKEALPYAKISKQLVAVFKRIPHPS
jgi:ribonuclease P protein component